MKECGKKKGSRVSIRRSVGLVNLMPWPAFDAAWRRLAKRRDVPADDVFDELEREDEGR